MELRKNESIFRVGAWNLAYWKAPWLLKALDGTATIEAMTEQARKDHPDTDFTKSLLPALKRLSRGNLVNRTPMVRQNFDKSWTLLDEPWFDGKCHTCKRDLKEGHLCHRVSRHKLGTTHRHVVCAKEIGVLHLSNTDYKIYAAGLKREHEFYDELMALREKLAEAAAARIAVPQFATASVELGSGALGVVNAKPA